MDDIREIKFSELSSDEAFVDFKVLKLQNPYKIHTHNYIEFVYGLQGESAHIVDRQEVILKSNQILIINKGAKHQNLLINNDCQLINFFVKSEYVDEIVTYGVYDHMLARCCKQIFDIKRNSFVVLDFDVQNYLELINQDIMYLENRRSKFFNLKLKMLLSTIIFKAIDIYGDSREEETEAEIYKSDLWKYFSQHMHRASFSEFAKSHHMSNASMSKKIRKIFNLTYTELLQEYRIEQAKKYLINTDSLIDEIMIMVGYSNKTHFYKIFAEKVGCSPHEFRKKNLK